MSSETADTQRVMECAVPFRLACCGCDVAPDIKDEDAARAAGWEDVEYDGNPADNESVFVWWSYLGCCPVCYDENMQREREIKQAERDRRNRRRRERYRQRQGTNDS